MASQKISQLTAITTVASGDYFPIVRASGTTNQRVEVGVLDERYTLAASGVAAQDTANTALASGNAALFVGNAALPQSGGTLTGDLTLNAQSDLRFADSDSSNWVAFQAAATVASNVTWTLPDADGSSGDALTTNGSGVLSWAAGGVESGTVMLFVQTAAPTGWTKSTTHNDKALRVVSGTASTGGSTAFTTVFTSRTPTGTVGSTTLTSSQIPSHSHFTVSTFSSASTNVISSTSYVTDWSAASYDLRGRATTATHGLTSSTGGGSSHDHSFTGDSLDFAVQYVDVIIATKD